MRLFFVHTDLSSHYYRYICVYRCNTEVCALNNFLLLYHYVCFLIISNVYSATAVDCFRLFFFIGAPQVLPKTPEFLKFSFFLELAEGFEPPTC